LTDQSVNPARVLARNFDEHRSRARLAQPEVDLLRRGVVAVGDVAGLDEPVDHEPVLVPLRLLRLDEVGQREQVVRLARSDLHRRAAFPQGRKRIDAAQD